MSMSVGGDKQNVMCDINTTPLIDVMLVLLITIIMTLPVQTHAVKLNMPPPTNAPPPETVPKTIDLVVDFDDSIYWNGNKADLEQLDGYFRSEFAQVQSTGDEQPEIHLRPDKRSHYDTTAKVLAAAQRNHMEKIGFVNTTEFSQ
jgi:biopolymer transport protein ExbD